MTSLAASFYECQRTTRQAASNFYLSFFLLPRRKRKAMCALYAFFRKTDDLVDNNNPPEEKRKAIAAWRAEYRQALHSESRGTFPALVDTINRYDIPPSCLAGAIDGAEMDIDHRGYATFDDLAIYIDRVAVTVGVACLYVWGFHDDRAKTLATDCGRAFQLTNILRDLSEDHADGRCYLPQDELAKFGVSAASLLETSSAKVSQELLTFQVQRAEKYFRRAAELETMLSREGRRSFRVMFGVYRALLKKIAARGGELDGPRVRLTTVEKAKVVGGAMLGRSVCPAGRAVDVSPPSPVSERS